jgi:hypothetical protein
MLSVVLVVANFDEFLIPFFSKKIRKLQQSISFPKYFLQNGGNH